jgi:hypothetical protein
MTEIVYRRVLHDRAPPFAGGGSCVPGALPVQHDSVGNQPDRRPRGNRQNVQKPNVDRLNAGKNGDDPGRYAEQQQNNVAVIVTERMIGANRQRKQRKPKRHFSGQNVFPPVMDKVTFIICRAAAIYANEGN